MYKKYSATALIIFSLFVFAFTQTISVGCKHKKSDKNAEAQASESDESGSEDVTFSEQSVASGEDWRVISKHVVEDMEKRYKPQGITISSLEATDVKGEAMRLILYPRENMSTDKQLLDGMMVLYDNFPSQNHYYVEIAVDGSPKSEATWDQLVDLAKSGYSLATETGNASGYMSRLGSVSTETTDSSE
jgi:hypothetical protein